MRRSSLSSSAVFALHIFSKGVQSRAPAPRHVPRGNNYKSQNQNQDPTNQPMENTTANHFQILMTGRAASYFQQHHKDPGKKPERSTMAGSAEYNR